MSRLMAGLDVPHVVHVQQLRSYCFASRKLVSVAKPVLQPSRRSPTVLVTMASAVAARPPASEDLSIGVHGSDIPGVACSEQWVAKRI